MCVIAVDYDGTVTADFDEARRALQILVDAGHVIIIWSSRNNPKQHGENKNHLMKEMEASLEKYQIPYHEIDQGCIGKLHAQVYIDDKAIRFENNWGEILKRIY